MGRMILKMSGAFFIAVMMVVTFGIFAGNEAGADQIIADNLIVDSNLTVGGDLGVIGDATVTGALGVTGATTTNGITNTGLIGTDTLNTTGDAAVGGALAVTGAATLNDGLFVTSGNTYLNGDLKVAGTLLVNDQARLASTLGVRGATTLLSTLDVNGNLTANGTTNTIGTVGNSANTMQGLSNTITGYNGGVLPDNSIVVRENQTATVGLNSFNYGTQVTGGMYIDGSLGVNGNIYSLNPTANATINIGNNGLNIEGSTNTVLLVSDADDSLINAHTQLDLQPTSATLFVNTDSGTPHGLYIDQTHTVLTGGTNSTSMTLNDSGAAFRNNTTGGAARVTGVADGHNGFDAVNFRQMKTAYAGIASVAALAAIPLPTPGKHFTMGIGYGNFQGESAVAVGIKASIPNRNVSFTAGVGYSNDECTTSAGFGLSF